MGDGSEADEPLERPPSGGSTRVDHPEDVDDVALADVLTWLVAELGGEGVMVADDEGFVVLADDRAEAWFGYPAARLEGMRVGDLLSDPANPAADPLTVTADAGGNRRVDARRADATVRRVRLGAKPVTTRRGRFHVLTIIDSADTEVPVPPPEPIGRVLVVGPLDVRADSVVGTLDAVGAETLTAENARGALVLLESERPDVVVLDDDLSSVELFAELRVLRAATGAPIIVVSPHAEEDDRVGALQLGADDYVIQPFSTAELAERVRVVARRSAARTRVEILTFGDLEIELDARRASVADRDVQLSPIEFDLLVFLARTPRHVFSRADLLRHVWGSRADWQTEATVTEHVRRLRRKIEPDPNAPRRIITVHRAGYRFDP
ncbi:MAG TPA: winged helix-turn-helix domain-containing protein [Acidimicrobiia bacterium]|nr:winged helix-turn-helix domain-containing protein [Acidimicrobiia bacterium]